MFGKSSAAAALNQVAKEGRAGAENGFVALDFQPGEETVIGGGIARFRARR